VIKDLLQTIPRLNLELLVNLSESLNLWVDDMDLLDGLREGFDILVVS